MTAHTRLLVLPDRPDAPATWLLADGGGRIIERGHASGTRPLPARAGDVALREWLLVPGSHARAVWLELPTRNPVQALAAARLLLEDHIAGPVDALHIAIAPLQDDPRRLVVAADGAAMRGWIDQAAALGMTPDVVVPTPLLLPLPPAPDDGPARDDTDISVAVLDGEWLVRGTQLAFAAEPDLAALAIAGLVRHDVADPVAAIAASAAAGRPPVNLLQYGFARDDARPRGWPAWRRAAMLAAAAALSPLLLLAAQVAGDTLASDRLQARAAALAGTAVPDLAPAADPVIAVRERLAALQAPERFARTTAGLLRAVESVEGAGMEAMTWRGGELQATLVHAGAHDLDAIRAAAAAAGLELTDSATGHRNGRVTTRTHARPAP